MDENDAPQNRSNDDAELSKSSDEHVSSCKRREKKLQSNYGQYVSYASLYAEVSFGLCDFSNFFFHPTLQRYRRANFTAWENKRKRS